MRRSRTWGADVSVGVCIVVGSVQGVILLQVPRRTQGFCCGLGAFGPSDIATQIEVGGLADQSALRSGTVERRIGSNPAFVGGFGSELIAGVRRETNAG